MNIKDNKTKAVGYIRVSTQSQRATGEGLEKQAKKIREWCKKKGIELLGIHEDIASATGDHSYKTRTGLQDAHKLALREQAILVVSDPTRLFRNLTAAGDFLNNLPKKVFSIQQSRYLSQEGLRKYITKGAENAENAENIAEGTRKALKKVKASNQKLGSPSGLDTSRKASINVRKRRAQKIVEKIAAILEENEAYSDLPNRAFADLLNKRGILTGSGRHWTRDTVLRKRKAAKVFLQERDQLEAELDAEEAAATTSPNPKSLKDNEVALKTEEELAEQAELERNPTFGLF